MIIWLNGTYGVGKSTIANEIREQLSGKKVEIFESDELFETVGQELLLHLIKNGGGLNPQNNEFFLGKVLDKIKEYLLTDDICIVPMALTSIEGKEIVWDYISQHCDKCKHFVLDAEESIIRERIEQDSKRIDKNFAIQQLSTNVLFINKHFSDAIRIDTNNKVIEDIAREIVKYIDT